MPVQVTEEEIRNELAIMQHTGKHHISTKKIDKKVNSYNNTKVILVFTLLLSLLLCEFVLLSSIASEISADGYIIQVDNNLYKDSTLKLGFDPNYDPEFTKLIGKGLGYDTVSSFKGGSLFSNLEMSTTMFTKFKDFAENKDKASLYEENEGTANFDQYYCNKYYLKNTGNKTVYYRLNIQITQNEKNALDAARFMLVTGEADTGYEYQIFATPNEDTGEQEVAASKKVHTATGAKTYYFTNPNLNGEVESENSEDAWLCENLIKDLKTGFYNFFSCTISENGEILDGQMYALDPGDSMCYTICIWFEGSDPDHNNDIIGGGITFSINYETEKYLKTKYFQSNKKN